MLLDREIQDSRLMHYLSEERDKKLSENKATRDSIEREHKKEVEVYTRACWIKIKGKELFLPITEEMPDGLTPQQKADLLKTHSTKKTRHKWSQSETWNTFSSKLRSKSPATF